MDWIFNCMLENLKMGNQVQAEYIQNTKLKIKKVLKFLRCEKHDVPYITKYQMEDLYPELDGERVWQIFNLDVEFRKFIV